MLRCSTTESETLRCKIYYEVYITRFLHTARTSNVDSVIFVNRIREMVSFELGKEIEENALRLVTSVTCLLMVASVMARDDLIKMAC